MTDDLVPPEAPTPMMLTVLKSGTGARAQTVLHHEMKVYNCIMCNTQICALAKYLA